MQKKNSLFLFVAAVVLVIDIVTSSVSFSPLPQAPLLQQPQPQPSITSTATAAVVPPNDYTYRFPPTAMDTFLASIRPRLDSEEHSHVIIVTGNESAGTFMHTLMSVSFIYSTQPLFSLLTSRIYFFLQRRLGFDRVRVDDLILPE